MTTRSVVSALFHILPISDKSNNPSFLSIAIIRHDTTTLIRQILQRALAGARAERHCSISPRDSATAQAFFETVCPTYVCHVREPAGPRHLVNEGEIWSHVYTRMPTYLYTHTYTHTNIIPLLEKMSNTPRHAILLDKKQAETRPTVRLRG